MPELADPATLIAPYGGTLVNLFVPADKVQEARAAAALLPSIQISDRAVCDLELLSTGAFSPLQTFMGEADYKRVLDEMRLADGTLWPIPVTLPVFDDAPVAVGNQIALRDPHNNLLATMTVKEIYAWDPNEAARKYLGTEDARHPLVAEMHRWGKRFISGPIQMLQPVIHHNFLDLRLTPAQTREHLAKLGNSDVVAFQTRNPIHRAHEELTKRAADKIKGSLLIHPVVGMTRPGDVDYYTRVRAYKALVRKHYDGYNVSLALLPLAMRMAGPREALWHAIIRRNHGVNHFIVGRDHASPGVDSKGKPFYGPYDAQKLLEQHAKEIGITPLFFEEMVYLKDEDRYEERSKVTDESKIATISGTQVRENYLHVGKELPEWFTRREVAQILAHTYPARHEQGICIWFTGLSGAGKSTTADVLTAMLMETGRTITVLDGDVVRTHLSKGLGFSKEDRDTNILRIGYVAAEIVRHGGTVICAAVSPYHNTRNEVRNMVGADRFIEVYVNTSFEVCEQRDTKGMYAKARRGEIKGFTGLDDAYEAPESPEITLDTVKRGVQENASLIMGYLAEQGFIQKEDAV
jgi:sulfate adenylyltransferase